MNVQDISSTVVTLAAALEVIKSQSVCSIAASYNPDYGQYLSYELIQ